MEMRVAKRHKWFYNFYLAGLPKKPAGFVLDLSESGALIWINYPTNIQDNIFEIVIHPPIESGVSGDIYLTLMKKWSEITVTEAHEKVGCQFVNLENDEIMKLNHLLEYLDIQNNAKSLKA